ncbi:hypothetical protein [Paenibacillus puerhi]|uniref:hypothetical protein n=1 Tax=Paenibacillus puerhi TaxID=2692622 RepID=UPI0013573403|nr:hypothetical protein [Paenibacillus puerhi]
MNNDMNVNHLIREMKETTVPEVDITGKVMQKVYAYQKERTLPRQRSLKIRPAWIMACITLVVATASVGAAALYTSTWNGIEISIDHGNATVPAVKNGPTYADKLETALAKSTDIWKTLSLEEAEQQFSFRLVRPQESKFTLVKSFGVVPKEAGYRVKTADEWWLGGFYDRFQWKQQDIVVKQDLDIPMTEALQDRKTMSLTFHEAPWRNVNVTDDTLAMFTEDGSKNLLLVKYKTADNKVISLEFQGNLPQEDLVTLAKAYVGS